MDAWNLPDRAETFQGYNFSQFVWATFNQTGGVTAGPKAHCEEIADGPANPCTISISCGVNEIAPAGFLIINSLVNLNEVSNVSSSSIKTTTYGHSYSAT